MDYLKKTAIILLLFFGFLFLPDAAHAAKLFLSPSSGTFTVGSTFDVDIFLNTENTSVNTVSAILSFPSDKLQLVSPTIGQSVVSVWTAQPVFNNQTGLVKLTGGIPGGINVQSGLITSLKFRVKQVGSSTLVKFTDESLVLANNGSGTDVLSGVQNGVYNLILPPPQGPVVSSETHPDQAKWYANKNVILRWASTSSVESYSYILSDSPADYPDNISDGSNDTVVYKNLSEGTHYFHIKSLRNGIWGGVTSFGINVDTEPPAEFSADIIPSSRTSSSNQIVNFQTSDIYSGVSYYEVKIVSLNPYVTATKDNSNFFTEATSPYQMVLGTGKYDIIVRAYDNAGNYREVASRLRVVTPIFAVVGGQGIKVFSSFVIPWLWFWMLVIIASVILSLYAHRIKTWHDNLAVKRKNKELPQDVKSQLETLKAYRKKYGNLLLLAFLVAGSLFFSDAAFAQESQDVQLTPPYVSSVSKNISNEEIFYVGGKTDESGITIIIYLQNLQTGETFNESVVSDSRGDWFYRHETFLTSGEYLLWVQGKLGEQASPPSPQIRMTVQKTAIQFGGSRFSYEMLYLLLVILFLIIIIGLVVFIAYHAYHGKKKHRLFSKEVMEAEESIRRGFAVLKRDIEAEVRSVRKAKLADTASLELSQREEHLLKDLDSIQKHVSKELWDVERVGNL